MPFVRDSYSFADFVTQWAEESGRSATDLAVILAQAIGDGEVECDVHYPNDPGPTQNQQVPYEEHTDWQDFEAGVFDHLFFVRQGSDTPDFVRRLRYVILDHAAIAAWFAAHGEAMPEFWRPAVSGTSVDAAVARSATPARVEDASPQHQRVMALLAWLLSDRAPKFRNHGRPNVLQIRKAALELLDSVDPERLAFTGIKRANFDAIVSAALKQLKAFENAEKESDE